MSGRGQVRHSRDGCQTAGPGADSARRGRVGFVWSLVAAFALLASVGFGQTWLAVTVLVIGTLLTLALMRSAPPAKLAAVSAQRDATVRCIWDPDSEA